MKFTIKVSAFIDEDDLIETQSAITAVGGRILEESMPHRVMTIEAEDKDRVLLSLARSGVKVEEMT